MQCYSEETEDLMRRYYEDLNERDRRRDAGIEAFKLGHGGQNYIAKILGCSRKIVGKGAVEVSKLPMRTVQNCIGKYQRNRPKYVKWGVYVVLRAFQFLRFSTRKFLEYPE